MATLGLRQGCSKGGSWGASFTERWQCPSLCSSSAWHRLQVHIVWASLCDLVSFPAAVKKYSDKSSVGEGGWLSVWGYTVHCVLGEVLAAGSGDTSNLQSGSREWQALLLLAFSFLCQPRPRAREWCCPRLRVCLFTSSNPIWIIPYRHGQRRVSWVILDPGELRAT